MLDRTDAKKPAYSGLGFVTLGLVFDEHNAVFAHYDLAMVLFHVATVRVAHYQ